MSLAGYKSFSSDLFFIYQTSLIGLVTSGEFKVFVRLRFPGNILPRPVQSGIFHKSPLLTQGEAKTFSFLDQPPRDAGTELGHSEQQKFFGFQRGAQDKDVFVQGHFPTLIRVPGSSSCSAAMKFCAVESA